MKKISNITQTNRLQKEIEKTINYFADEYNLSTAEIYGVLEIVKFNILHEDME